MPKKLMSEEEKERKIKEAQERYNQRKPAITFRIDREAKERIEELAEKEGVPLGTFLYNSAMSIANVEEKLSEERERYNREVLKIMDKIKGLFKYIVVLMIVMPIAIYIFSITDSYQIIPIFSIIIAVVVFLLFYFTLYSIQ
ncbi:MAG: hypothetical protein SVE93_05975 [Candidatus Thermoplasmatota archaeon]|nr:hypothetical protein [Candidatus Thermoplasmatota archaeon]